MYNQGFIEELIAKRNLHLEQIQHIDAILSFSNIDPSSYSNVDLSIGRNLSGNEKMPYQKGDGYQQKIAGLLKQYNRFLSINEMANLVNHFEPKITLDDAKRGLGSAKNLLIKQGVICKVQVGTNNSNTFYGSPSWLHETGEPKEENKYDVNAVQQKTKIEI